MSVRDSGRVTPHVRNKVKAGRALLSPSSQHCHHRKVPGTENVHAMPAQQLTKTF